MEVRDKRYNTHTNEKNIFEERREPNFLRNQYPVVNETKIRRNQKANKIENDELQVIPYPKKKSNKNLKMMWSI